MKLKFTLLSCLLSIYIQVISQPTLDFARSFGGSVLEGSTCIKVDDSGSSYTIGTFAGSVDFDTGPGVTTITSNGQEDIFILKLDSLGNQVWNKRIGGVTSDYATGLDLDDTGNIYITGTFGDTVDFDPGPGIISMGTLAYNTFILKMDPAGNLVWVKILETSGFAGVSMGATLTVDDSNNVVCTGSFYGAVDFDPGAGTAIHSQNDNIVNYLLKLTSSGSFIFVKEIFCTETMYYGSLKTDPAGNMYFCGSFTDSLDADPGPGTAYLVSPDGYYQGFVAKYSASGNLIWYKALGEHATIPFTRANAIGLDAAGNVYICGQFSNNCDFDPGPATFLLAAPGGDIDVFSVKLNNSGNFIWAQNIGGENGQAYGMYVDEFGNQVITGHFNGDLDCDPSSGVFNIYSHASYFDVFTLMLDASGSLISAFNIGSTYHDYGYAIDINRSHIYITGAYSLTCDFDPGFLYVPYTSQGNVDVFVAKYNAGTYLPLPTSIREYEENKLSVFPNPFTDKLNIKWSGGEAKVSVLNALGKKVIDNRNLNPEQTTLDLHPLSAGIYFLILDSKTEHICKKIIKE